MTFLKPLGVVVAIVLACAGSASAACTEAMLEKLLAQGFSRPEILQLCAQTGGGAQAGPGGVIPEPVAPPANPVPDAAAALIGSWVGNDAMNNSWQFTFNADKTYQAWMRSAQGYAIVQNGEWSAANSIMTMNPTSMSPPAPTMHSETHAYSIEGGGGVLVLQGSAGALRLSRRP